MKAFRALLFALIVLGLLLIMTERLWVPKLVAYIVARENSTIRADASTRLSAYYVKDSQHIWYSHPELEPNPKMLSGVDSSTFELFATTTPYTYAKDARRVYWIIDDAVPLLYAHPKTFNTMQYFGLLGLRESGYGKDDTHAYYNGNLIPGAEPSTFVLVNIDNSHVTLPSGYAKDSAHVYLDGVTLRGGDPATFVSFSDPDSILTISKDAHSVYFSTTTVRGVDAPTFSLLRTDDGYSTGYAKDKNHVYHYSYTPWKMTIVPDVDPRTFIPKN